MIEKLRNKIFWIIQISLSVIVLGVIILFTSYNYKNTITSSLIVMDRLEKRIDHKQKAHQQNDIAVMEAYGFDWRNMTESDCVAELMKMYQKLTCEDNNE